MSHRLIPGPEGQALQDAYDRSAAIITGANGPVAISRVLDDGEHVLTLDKSPATGGAGSALAVTMGANATGPAISVANSGSGADVLWGTSQLKEGSVYLQEKAAANTDVAGLGQLWAKTGDELWFTGPGGADVQLGVGGSEATVTLLGGTAHTQQDFNDFYDGALMEALDVDVASNGTVITLSTELPGGGDLHVRINSKVVLWDNTPADTVVLTAGTDTVPQTNFVYITEALGVVTLASSTSGWPPSTEYAAIAIVYCQSAASLQADGPLKVHAYVDHIHNGTQGHLSEMNRWIRLQAATWFSGISPGDMAVSSPDAYLSTGAGVVFQLHEHTMPARDMATGDPAWVVNDPTTSFKRITTLDDITQLSDSGAVNNRWFSLVLWGSVNEDEADCKLFINLPSGSYSNQSAAEEDSDGYTDFSIPVDFKGTGFLIARYNVQGASSGAWTQGSKVDLRGLFPASSPGASGGVTDHSALSNLGADDHTQYLLVDGSRAMTGAINIDAAGLTLGGHTITDTLISTDGASTSDTVYVTPGWIDANIGGSVPDPLLLSVGSEVAPTYSYTGRTGVGAWSPAVDEYAISTGSTEAVHWGASQIQTNAGVLRGVAGNSTTPTYSFTGQTNGGLYSGGTSVRIAYNGSVSQRWQFGASIFSVSVLPNTTSAYNLGSSTAGWETLYIGSDAIGTAETIGAELKNATAAANAAQQFSPMLVWEGQGWDDTVTQATAEVKMAAQLEPVQDGGALPDSYLVFKSSIDGGAYADVFSVDSRGGFRVPNGTGAGPTMVFAASSGTGFWANDANDIRVSTQSTARFSFQDDRFISLFNGSAATPAIGVNSNNSGLFAPSTNEVGIASAGVEAGRFDNDATAGNTRFMLYDVDNGTLERVTVGAADSGGTNFKVLRIPN